MFNFSFGAYVSDLHSAAARARLGWAVVVGWIAFPFIVATLVHPADAIRLQYFLQGQAAPHLLTKQQIALGLVETLAAGAVLLLFQMVCTVLFYRRVRLDGERPATPTLWPLAAILPGIVGNAAWFIGTQHFDGTGFAIGLTPVVLTVAAEWIVNGLGRDFVFGPQVSGMH